MNLHEINQRLEQLTANPSREAVFDLSFALLNWMNIEPVTDSKPQLLAPQTQKLKDYLFPAPKTVQAQLYRLSAEKENIRVRFAVLKKIKKEYISQLVDNDPGLGSYQAFMKNLDPSVTTHFIPSQPYFIHFITTPDYNQLMLVFNLGDQKRIVSFRKRFTQTQYNKIIHKWEGIGKKPKPEISEILWKSLDIKEVNKEFYKLIKERFDALLGILSASNTPILKQERGEIITKQFAVRLIGRYIYCWFLKEKGIIPESLLSSEKIRQTEKFYQTTLLPLFFKTLNTKVQDRTLSADAIHAPFRNIPYLNGGLFDESEEDKLFATLEPEDWLLPFVEILESFDFTVDESNSQYQQVAVDPEMLGRIFENLLASQNEETEKLANQRKAFGAFYTPREIVDYMVNESLKAYLLTQWKQTLFPETAKPIINKDKKKQAIVAEPQAPYIALEKKLEPLFAANPESSQLKKEEKIQLQSFLEQIKILDPACGSGAFPMGILHKLVELHETLGTVKSGYELKKEILSQNIFGVDIMPMAIEIARIRAWLSLVLEENYNPKDAVHNFGVKPLPNLDFKFVCANSLIDLGLDEIIKNDPLGLLTEIYAQLNELAKLRTAFFSPTLASHEKDKLKDDFINKRKILIEKLSNESDNRLKVVSQKLEHWNPFDDSQPSPFFSPLWMFGIEEGFDVVIGNPPYVQMQKNKGQLSEQLKNAGYATFERTGDIYALFYELGFKILRTRGIHAFITSSQWLKAAYGKSLRKLFLSKNPLRLIALGPGVFESAVVDTNILLAQNQENQQLLSVSTIDQPEQLESLNTLKYHPLPNLTTDRWAIGNEGKQSLNQKIKTKGKPLKEWDIKINFGIKTGYNEAFIIDEEKRKEIIKSDPKSAEIIKPLLRGREVEKYLTEWDGGYLIATFPALNININKYKGVKKYLETFLPKINQTGETFINNLGEQEKTRKKTGNQWFETQDQIGYYEEFSKEKIIWKRIGSQLRFSYSSSEIHCLDSTCILTGEKNKYLTGILNSNLSKYQLFDSAPKTGMGDLIISVQALEPLLVYYPTNKEQKQIEKLVDTIIKKKQSAQDTLEQERQIDLLVYQFYELTYEEVKIIDPEFWMLEEEYIN